jgi:hypothetical protein
MTASLLACQMLCALSALLLGMPVHRQRLAVGAAGRWRWRALGLFGLLLAGVDSCRWLGTGTGLVAWCGWLMLDTFCLALLLAYRPRWIVRLLPLAAALVVVLPWLIAV